MAKTTFDTNPVSLRTLLKTCEDGKLQLSDCQRSWVWEEERIMSLITGHAVSAIAEAAEEGDDIPTSMAHDSGLDLIETD